MGTMYVTTFLLTLLHTLVNRIWTKCHLVVIYDRRQHRWQPYVNVKISMYNLTLTNVVTYQVMYLVHRVISLFFRYV